MVYALRAVASHSKDGGAERHGWGKLLYNNQVQAANIGFLAHLSGVLAGQVRLHLLPPGECDDRMGCKLACKLLLFLLLLRRCCHV